MESSSSSTRLSVGQLIFVPAVITLAVTILRLVGELQHWPSPWFNPAAGGGGAVIGITWLPFIFGPYFALRLARAGEGPSGLGKAIGFTVGAIALFMGGGRLLFAWGTTTPVRGLAGVALMVLAGVVPAAAWPKLFKTLLAYAYAARIPVAIVMYFAMQGNWGTHYDAVEPEFAAITNFWAKYIQIALIPQLLMWIAFTIIVGTLLGSLIAAIALRGKPAVHSAAN